HAAQLYLSSLRTRRSSDLEALLHRLVFDTEWGPAELARLRGAHPGSLHLAEVDIRLAVRQGDAERAVREAEHLIRMQPGRSGHRSEEHTSELQSRENLVCR